MYAPGVANGRVVGPESGLDAVRNVGVRAGRIEQISTTPLNGARVIDASGLVVAPGFIDLHEHGQQEEAYALMVRDGVTSALELEAGAADGAAWYAGRERPPGAPRRCGAPACTSPRVATRTSSRSSHTFRRREIVGRT